MTDFKGALSSFRQKVSDYFTRFNDWAERKIRGLKPGYRQLKDNLRVYGRYFLFEFAPFVVAYGLMLNFPVSVFLGWGFTVETVVAWGLVFSLIDTEFHPMIKELLAEMF